MVHWINNHATRKHWECILKSDAPASLILLSTCTFRIKRNRSTSAIIKFKARFCANSRAQELDVNFHETWDPVVKWETIRTCLTQEILNNWHAKVIDFDQAYDQADCDADV